MCMIRNVNQIEDFINYIQKREEKKKGLILQAITLFKKKKKKIMSGDH